MSKQPKNSALRFAAIAQFVILATFLFVSPALAKGGGHLWFYSQDPSTLPGPQPLPNPQTYDPKYVSASPDPWLAESIVIQSSDLDKPFTIWLACAQFESIGTKLVVSINKIAHYSIEAISINGNSLGPWDTSGDPPAKLAPHGVFNSAEFYGYAEATIGNLYSPPSAPYKTAITVNIELKEGASLSKDAKIHFDAYGYTEEGAFMFSPYSHDATFVVPELATLFTAIASFVGLAAFAFRKRVK